MASGEWRMKNARERLSSGLRLFAFHSQFATRDSKLSVRRRNFDGNAKDISRRTRAGRPRRRLFRARRTATEMQTLIFGMQTRKFCAHARSFAAQPRNFGAQPRKIAHFGGRNGAPGVSGAAPGVRSRAPGVIGTAPNVSAGAPGVMSSAAGVIGRAPHVTAGPPGVPAAAPGGRLAGRETSATRRVRCPRIFVGMAQRAAALRAGHGDATTVGAARDLGFLGRAHRRAVRLGTAARSR